MDKSLNLTKNEVAAWLGKSPADFSREDIVRFITENDVEMVNFMYPAADGRLKTLNFVINSLEYLETILTLGERVDGSSLFQFISAGSSDLYVVPRYRTAFVDPFAPVKTLTMLCSFFDKDGHPLASSPEVTLDKACRRFTEATGLHFHAMGELEFYVIAPDPGSFPATDQRGYHESGPFAKFNDFRTLCMSYIARTGGQIKYGHSEVGNFTLNGLVYEQNEIEFLPVDARDAADQLMLAKWVIRNLASKMDLNVTFAPKITIGKAGSGLHVHMRLMHPDGRTAMLTPARTLSEAALRGIAGIMDLAPALTAFGTTTPTRSFRLVRRQDAPTNVCWGDRNRSVLVRVPLGWTAEADMCAEANPGNPTPADTDASRKQTFESRSADGSADIYQLMAGLAVAVRHGFEMPDALDVARHTYVDVNIHSAENAPKLASLATLPVSCGDSASCLEARAGVFTDKDVFSQAMIDGVCSHLRAQDDEKARHALEDPDKMLEMVKDHFHCG